MPVPNLASTVRRFSFPVERLRYLTAESTDEYGNRVHGATMETTILAHVKYASAKTLNRLPEGYVLGSAIEVRVPGEDVMITDVGKGQRGDVIKFDGHEYELDFADRRHVGADGVVAWGIYFGKRLTNGA